MMMNTGKLFLFAAMMVATGFVSSCNKTVDNPTVNTPTTTDPQTGQPQDSTNNGNNDNPTKAKLSFTNKTAPVLLEMTSTGCPGCGGWGKPTFAKLVQSYQADVTPVAVHIKYGDPMITTESTAIWDNIEGSRYTPMIFVQNDNAVVLNGGSISAESEQNARNLIDAALTKAQPALAANIVKKDGSWDVTYGVKFDAAAAEGEYSLACYITEDGIVYHQTSYANNPATHNHVIRTSADGAFGAGFTAADLQDNEQARVKRIKIDDAYNKDKLYVTLVLWKKVNGRYEVVNGAIVK